MEKGIKVGVEKGIKIGVEKGRKEGVEEGKLADALEMLRDGVPSDKIMKYTGLSREQVEGLREVQ